MNDKRIGFIGGGNMTFAIAGGMLGGGYAAANIAGERYAPAGMRSLDRD